MLRIGICDDDREYREKIHDLVIHSIFSYDDAQVVHYMSGKQVVDDIEKEEFDIDLLLLDINMPEYDGLNTAKYIRENNVDVDIIFITVSAEHIFDGYTYKAFSYILKPVDKKRLDDEIGRYMTERSKCTNCFIDRMNKRYRDITIGYSGHENPDDNTVAMLAVAKGAKILERHVALPTEQYSINAYSMTPCLLYTSPSPRD